MEACWNSVNKGLPIYSFRLHFSDFISLGIGSKVKEGGTREGRSRTTAGTGRARYRSYALFESSGPPRRADPGQKLDRVRKIIEFAGSLRACARCPRRRRVRVWPGWRCGRARCESLVGRRGGGDAGRGEGPEPARAVQRAAADAADDRTPPDTLGRARPLQGVCVPLPCSPSKGFYTHTREMCPNSDP